MIRNMLVLLSFLILFLTSGQVLAITDSDTNDSGSSVYSDYMLYTRAYDLGITTAPTIEDAHLDGLLYRKVAAKMLTEFAIKVVGRTPDTDRKCVFKDNNNEIEELQEYMILACQLGIMGVDYFGNPVSLFNPNHFFTRDQLITTLSRIYFGNTYNIVPGEMPTSKKIHNFFVNTYNNITRALHINNTISPKITRYTKHMEIIKPLGIMTNYTPRLKEHRIHVLRILYKLNQLGYKEI